MLDQVMFYKLLNNDCGRLINSNFLYSHIIVQDCGFYFSFLNCPLCLHYITLTANGGHLLYLFLLSLVCIFSPWVFWIERQQSRCLSRTIYWKNMEKKWAESLCWTNNYLFVCCLVCFFIHYKWKKKCLLPEVRNH